MNMTQGQSSSPAGSTPSTQIIIFEAKNEAVSRLMELVDEYATSGTMAIHPNAISIAKTFLRALPESISLPEFSADPDGSISLDWIESRNRLFSLSAGANQSLSFAWLDGPNKGHGVEYFDGEQIPKRIIDGITAIIKNGN